ncbi:MAG TPA: chromosome segregation protein SMC [Steroidobacteraceae bacterium]|nr:chromosome segregation protein SMC [Steroidobacteraceae bacterium]
MRLIKIKLSGFKSFVDPTTITFPGTLTGVVGPNGCGKSNIIDAVRWVMGELSARYLRGDSMADVVFNGSVSRKPVGSAAVELIFDNSDGKIGGPYASYGEISLRRTVARDGSSGYFLNGARCRRKDITQLFLGTGLGSRSYAIIEQGTISRVIEAKPEDMRALLEEAAGISRYKERRRETEARIADTRENLERLQDLRDEVDKQIRHLQRQAATARRYQALKEEERRAAAELLALKLRELDRGAELNDSATRERDLAMQSALAEQRSAEAHLERQRAVHGERSEQLSQAQGRYYEAGANVTRTEQSIEHTRELRERQASELAQARGTLAELGAHIERDEWQVAALRGELAELAPELAEAQREEHATAEAFALAEQELAGWQQRWEQFVTAAGAATQASEVERARIEQLEGQIERLAARAQRFATEREQVAAQDPGAQLAELTTREAAARERSEQLTRNLSASLVGVQGLRSEQLTVEAQLEAARTERERLRGELVSLEALQKAALGENGTAVEWLDASGLGTRPRVAETLEVEQGWERAVETALGHDLEAICIERLDELIASLEAFSEGRLALVEHREHGDRREGGSIEPAVAESLAAKIIRGPAAVRRQLSRVIAGESLAESLRRRASLGPEESIVTRGGEWIGRDWIRLRRGRDRQEGIIEREHRLKVLRAHFGAEEARVAETEAHLASVRGSLAQAEHDRERVQAGIQSAHREHAELLAQLEAARARAEHSAARRGRLEEETTEAAREAATAREALGRAREALERGLATLAQLESSRPALESERDERRERVVRARSRAQQGQLAARDLIVRSESRRSSEASVSAGLARMLEQRAQLAQRCAALEHELAGGDAPIRALEQRLEAFLAQRLEAEGELAAARRALEEAEEELRRLDELRAAAEQRVAQAREAMEQARLAAQETRVRREAIAEQFAASGFELAGVLAALPADAQWLRWEERLAELKGNVEKLGQVNLAAIDELKEQTERKAYLDRQFTDLTDALATLEEAMRRIDKETRTRFEETFERINGGLKEKFPRLFGGGHAYLELVGEDVLTAGVAVMARPPGKRNSTIHLLSGGEKALTAVALVFSIFDLNPAPFCLLDEVDAPLDEYNIGRFCDIVRDMSSRVQFIFVTHNKATMELASQLIGVTMSEPGVSRLVAVDVEEAMRLAAV